MTCVRSPTAESPVPEKVSDTALLQCLLAIVKEHEEQPGPPPDEETLHKDVERRLEAPVSRDRLRALRDRIAPKFKLSRGRPRGNAQ